MSNWKLECGRAIRLLTPREFEKVPDGTVLLSISGEYLTKGEDYCDNDTRFGHLAYGYEVTQEVSDE